MEAIRLFLVSEFQCSALWKLVLDLSSQFAFMLFGAVGVLPVSHTYNVCESAL